MAKWFGDDRQVRADSYEIDKAGLPIMSFMLGHVAHGSPPMRRLTMIGRFLAGGSREASGRWSCTARPRALLADGSASAPDVRDALAQAFERWDGKGVPGRCAGEQIDPVMRVVQVADDAEVFVRLGGVDAAVEMLRKPPRNGVRSEPRRSRRRHAEEVLGDIDERRVGRDRDRGSATRTDRSANQR